MSQKQFPDLFEADSLVNVSDDPELLARYLDECQGELAHFARLLGRFREAATIERERLERQYGSETLSAWNMIGLDRDKYVTSVFLCAPNDIRANVLKSWFRAEGSTWFEDNPHRADNTFCDACVINLADSDVYKNGSYVYCEDCVMKSIAAWEESAAAPDYFGTGVVENAIWLSEKELDSWFTNQSTEG